MRTHTSEPKLIGRFPCLIFGEEEIDTSLWPVHIARTVLESLFTSYVLFKTIKEVV